MLRVVGIDPGTVSIDVCGIDDGRLFLDHSFPTGRALAEPAAFVALLDAAGPLDLVAGPSGYGLPLTRVQDASDEDLRLAFLTAPGESGGIGGVSPPGPAPPPPPPPPGVPPRGGGPTTPPGERQGDRVDIGTAEEGGAAALAVDKEGRR